jgi:hypothetical protein
MVQPQKIMHFCTLATVKHAKILFNRGFTKGNATYFLKKSSSPLFLQELRPLTPLNATYTFTSLTVIGMTKILCNTKLLLESEYFQPRVCMPDDFSDAKRVFEEVLINLITERVMLMYTGVQASSMRGMQASPLNACGSRPS